MATETLTQYSCLGRAGDESRVKLVTIVGARPQFIKAWPVSRAIDEHNSGPDNAAMQQVLVNTGQHYDYEMSQVFFDELNLPPPDHSLGVGSGSPGVQTGEMLKRIEEVLLQEKPNAVLVYGDTNSTLAGALAACKLKIPVAHVEAGLRSFNRCMPEEINRIVADRLSTLLFAPTDTAVNNLRAEGISQDVYRVGDVMCDVLLRHREVAATRSDVLTRLKLRPKQYVLATIHRAENADNPARLLGILSALTELSYELPVVLPLHPRTRQALKALQCAITGNLFCTDPVSYLDMLRLESESRLILTDSGGVQKEAFLLRVPCVTLRDETEWLETVESGWNTVAGAEPTRIIDAARKSKPGRSDIAPFGSGDASRKIVGLIATFFASVPEPRGQAHV